MFEQIFLDPNGPFGFAKEFFLNGITETIGVAISVFLSIYFANYLDQRTEKRRAMRQRRLLAQELNDATNKILTGIPKYFLENDERVSTQNNQARSSHGLWVDIVGNLEIQYENLDPLIGTVLGEYGVYADPTIRNRAQAIKRHLRSIIRTISYESRFDGEFPNTNNTEVIVEAQLFSLKYHFQELALHTDAICMSERLRFEKMVPSLEEAQGLWRRLLQISSSIFASR